MLFFMFFKNVITKSLFLFFLGSVIGLHAMSTASVTSVFGHRLRLKNFTTHRLIVEVDKAREDRWAALVESHQSIDLGSIQDDFIKISITKHQGSLMCDSGIEITGEQIKEQINKFKEIPKNHVLRCVINNRGDTYSYYFESTSCEKNKFLLANPSDYIRSHPAYIAFPALENDTLDIYRCGTIEAFRESDPIKFYLDVLGLDSAFSPVDVIARANRLMREWTPVFYREEGVSEQIKIVQEYIRSANDFLLRALKAQTGGAATSSMASVYTQTEDLTAMMRQLTFLTSSQMAPQPVPDYTAHQAAPSTLTEIIDQEVGQVQKPQQQPITIDASYFRQLLERVKSNIIPVYEEQKKSDPAHNTMLLSVFKLKQPIIPFEELSELIDRCIQNFDNQIKIAVNDNVSYVQKQVLEPGDTVNITGDIHGSIHSLIRILDHALQNINAKTKFVFLGDYSDRGLFGTEVLAILMCLKIICWDSVFLIRGNHESYEMNSNGGWDIQNNAAAFKTELEVKYGLENGNKLLLHFSELYKRLPLAVYMGTNQNTWVQFCHGGLQPGFNPQAFLSNSNNIHALEFRGNFNSYLNGFVWGDFYFNNNQIIQDVSLRGKDLDFIPNILNVMSPNPAHQLPPECTRIKAIFRGHQHAGCGFKMFPKYFDESLRQYSRPLGLMPIPWHEVMQRECNSSDDNLIYEKFIDQDGDEHGKWKIRICHFTPIFTFSTATEHGIVDETYYGVLYPAENFNDWLLEPIAIPAAVTE